MRLTKARIAPLTDAEFTDEQKEGFAKTMGVAQEREIKDLQRAVRTLEGEVAELKKKLAPR